MHVSTLWQLTLDRISMLCSLRATNIPECYGDEGSSTDVI